VPNNVFSIYLIGILLTASVALVSVIYTYVTRKFPIDLTRALYPRSAQEIARQTLKAVGWGLIISILWPVTFVSLIYDRFFEERYLPIDRPAHEKLTCFGNLISHCTVTQAESDNLFDDPYCPNVPFGHLYHGWMRFKAARPDDSELWAFQADTFYGVVSGYAWVKEGIPSHEFIDQG
jgi:hypothetical protein